MGALVLSSGRRRSRARCSSRPSSRPCSSPTGAPTATSPGAGRTGPQERPRHRVSGRDRRRLGAAEWDDTDQVRPDRRDHREAGHTPAIARRRGRAGLHSPAGGRHRQRRSCSRARTRATCSSTSARSRPCCRRWSRCRARTTSTAAAALLRRGYRAARASIMLSRTHPNLVRKLFALEVPEIADGTVEIAAVAREAGHTAPRSR